MKIIKTVLISLFTIGLFFVSNAQSDANSLVANLDDYFLKVENNKTSVVFNITASENEIIDLKESSAKFTKYCSLNVENTSSELYKCILSFDKYEKSVSNYGFAQKMFFNFNINFFEYKGVKHNTQDLLKVTYKE